MTFISHPDHIDHQITAQGPALSGPLHIDFLRSPIGGEIGLTHCPGRSTVDRKGRQWRRDVSTDLHAISAANVKTVITFLDSDELSQLGAGDLPQLIKNHPIQWIQFPIVDFGVPSEQSIATWRETIALLLDQLRRNDRLLLHCAAGLGRSGMMAATLLKSCGLTADQAVQLIRSSRPGTVETREQEKFIRDF